MTDQQLRDLLEERVADVTTRDLVAGAWRSGRRARRRARVAVVGGAAVVVAAISTGVAVLGGDGSQGQGEPGPATVGPSPAGPTSASPPAQGTDPGPNRPDARYEGAPVWAAPSSDAEGGLPRLDGTGLPSEIDLAAGQPAASGLGRAVAVLGVWPDGPLSRVIAVGPDGGSYALDVAGVVGPVVDEGGNLIPSLSHESLSPDGRYVFFIQERSLEIYDFGTDEWTRVDTPVWRAEGARWVAADRIHVPEQLGSTAGGTTYTPDGREVGASDVDDPVLVWPGEDEAFGPLEAGWGDLAQARFLAGGLALDGTTFGSVDAVVATDRGEPHLLVFAPLDERWKGCCPVVGWAAPDTVLLESRHSAARVLAWRVGTHDVRQVSSITGWEAGEESYVASWAVTPDGA